MTNRATGTFEVTWDQHPPYDDAEGATLATASLTKQFTGDIEGASTAELITARNTDIPDSAGYVAMERVTGTVHGRSGTFVLQHSAVMSPDTQSLQITVVPATGTGELFGIAGTMAIDTADDHSYTFDYTLPWED